MSSQQGSISTPDNKADLKVVWSAFWKGCSRLVFQEAPQAWQGPDQSKYRAEREKILSHTQPVALGLFATGLCFVTFRISGSKWWKHMRQVYFFTSVVPEGTATAASTAAPAEGGYLARQALSKQNQVQELMQIPLDLTISVILGSATFMLLFDSDKLQDDLVQIPLLPGKSLIHQCVCADVVQAVRQAHQQGTFQHVDEETKKVFAYFAENCLTRSRYLERRKELGHNDIVPYPGLVGKITRD